MAWKKVCFVCLFVTSFLFLSVSCSSGEEKEYPDNTGVSDNDATFDDDAAVDGDSAVDDDDAISDDDMVFEDDVEQQDEDTFECLHECNPAIPSFCIAFNALRRCETYGDGCTRFVNEQCQTGSGCVRGACEVGRCSDECMPGEENNDGQQCGYYDITTDSWTEHDAEHSLHDRARQYLWWTDNKSMFQGYLTNFYYKDPPDYTVPDHVAGIGDTCIWTGTYLGSEALRYMTTGDPSAERHMETLIRRMHRLFKVSGTTAILSRFAIKSSVAQSLDYSFEQDCSETEKWHCGVPYEGEQWDYNGHISRDQYQGFWFGYSLAYDALPHREDLRSIIRNDIVELADELMKVRRISIEVRVDNLPVDHAPVDLGLSVLIPQEMAQGKYPIINYCHSEGPDCENYMRGMLEFIPDISELIKQINVLSWVPQGVPRAGSAIMMLAFFNIAMDVTAGVPGFEEKFKEISEFYYSGTSRYGNAYDWKDMAKGWFYNNKCYEKYYGINIAMEPMYNLMRLEKNEQLRTEILNDVLEAKMWDTVKGHKNSFFAYIYLSGKRQTIADVATMANTQLAQFMPPPKYLKGVDLRDDPEYTPFMDGCTNLVRESNAVDVGKRVMDDFIWQRRPYVGYHPEVKGVAYAGTDFVTAYWMARYHHILDENTSGICLRWKE